MASAQRDGDYVSDINVTPLVDVMLVLLVVLMVTASYTVSRALQVSLPQASTGSAEHGPLTLEVDARGNWRLDGQAISHEELEPRVEAMRSQGQEPSALLAADGEAAHRTVVEALDELRRLSVREVALAVRATEPR